MKKYMAPASLAIGVEMENVIALSLNNEVVDPADQLVRERTGWDAADWTTFENDEEE